jgi:hypothetical protein
MVGLEGEFYSLLSLMQTELYVKVGEGMYTMRRCLDDRAFDEGKICEGALTEGLCYGIMSLDYGQWMIGSAPVTVTRAVYTALQRAIDRHDSRILWRAKKRSGVFAPLDVLLEERPGSGLISVDIYNTSLIER